MTSTIALLNAVRNGQSVADIKLGGPDAPYRKTMKPAPLPKVHPVMSPEALAEKIALIEKLQVGKWIIEFNKVDGTPSIMECTLDPALLPPVDPLKDDATKRTVLPHLLHVYATDRSGWRSISLPNLKRIYQGS